MIRALIFDCFGVLVMSGRDSLKHDHPELAVQIHDLELQSDYGVIARDEFNQAVGLMIDMPAKEVDLRYWTNSSVRNESAFEWLRAEGNFKLGLLSNVGRGWLDELISPDERAELFDAVVLSSEVGMIKPDMRIFSLMAQKLGVETDECIMLDDLPVNIEGASRAGMEGVVFGSTSQAQHQVDTFIKEA